MNNETIEIIEQKTTDVAPKKEWAEGEWTNEPDYLHFVDRATDMDCLVVRNHSGGLCGYVAVEEGHPLYGSDYSSADIDCHGGLTYASHCAGHICHVPRDGRPDHVWWLGFDCGHPGDLTPAFTAKRYRDLGITDSLNTDFMGNPSRYRNINYVIGECQKIAQQLKDRNVSRTQTLPS